MDAITAMTTRRSIRKYTSDPVKPEDPVDPNAAYGYCQENT